MSDEPSGSREDDSHTSKRSKLTTETDPEPSTSKASTSSSAQNIAATAGDEAQPSTSANGNPPSAENPETNTSNPNRPRRSPFARRKYRCRTVSSSSPSDDSLDSSNERIFEAMTSNPTGFLPSDILDTDSSGEPTPSRLPYPYNSDDSLSVHGLGGPDEDEDEEEDDDEDNNSDSDANTDSTGLDSDVEAQTDRTMSKQEPKNQFCLLQYLLDRQCGIPLRGMPQANRRTAAMFTNRISGSLFAVERLELAQKLERHTGCVNSLNFNRSGDLLVSGSDDLKVIVWNWATNTPIHQVHTQHKENVFQSKFVEMAENTSGLNIVTSSRDGSVRLVSIDPSGGPSNSRVLATHRQGVHKIALIEGHPQELLSAAEEGNVLRIDLREKKPQKLLTLRNGSRRVPLYSIASHPLDPIEFCVCGGDQFVRVYDQRNVGKCLRRTVPAHLAEVDNLMITCAVYNYVGTEIVASYSGQQVYLFKNSEGNHLHAYSGHISEKTIKGVNFFGPRSEFVMTGSDCGNFFIWDKETEAIVQCLEGDEEGIVNCLEGHPSVPVLATSGLDHNVKIWLPTNGNGKPDRDSLKRRVRRNIKNRGDPNYSISELNNTLVEYFVQHFSRRCESRRRSALNEPNQSSDSSSASESSVEEFYNRYADDDEEDEDDDIDDDNGFGEHVSSGRRYGPQNCSPS